jgi:hypothetical protein
MSRKAPSLSRSKPFKDPRRKIWAFCEGEKTEPDWIEWFAACYGANVRVEALPGHGDPRTAAEAARAMKKALLAKRSTDIFNPQKDSIWVVVDVDAHAPHRAEPLAQAINIARDNRIEIAISNP